MPGVTPSALRAGAEGSAEEDGAARSLAKETADAPELSERAGWPQGTTGLRPIPSGSRLRGRLGRALASQSGEVAQTVFIDRAPPNEKEFSGERSESAATTG